MPTFVVYEVWTRSYVVEAADDDKALLDYPPTPVEGLSLCNWHAVRAPGAPVGSAAARRRPRRKKPATRKRSC